MNDEAATIPGYRYGDPSLEPSPVTEEDLRLLQATLLWSPQDDAALRQAGEVLADQADDLLDVWYGYVGSHPHLVAHFSTPGGEPIEDYLGRVRARFRQWILDTCNLPYDRAWLDWQQEIALRHHAMRKNRTDGVESTPQVPLRYLVAFIYPITVTTRQFLAAKGHSDDQVEAMLQAWFKTVTLQAALWAQPYAPADW